MNERDREHKKQVRRAARLIQRIVDAARELDSLQVSRRDQSARRNEKKGGDHGS